jgi:hypothetical protein
MSEQELVFNVKELHVISLTCSECGNGTIFDFNSSDYLENFVSPNCTVCKAELMVDLQKQLKAYHCFYDSMSRCQQVKFRVRLETPEAALSATAAESAAAVSAAAVVSATALSATAAESALEVREMVSTAVAEVQQVAITAAATTIESATEVKHMVSTAMAQVHEMASAAVTDVQQAVVKILAREHVWARKHGTEHK